MEEKLLFMVDVDAEGLMKGALPWTVDFTRALVLKRRETQPQLRFDYVKQNASSLLQDSLTSSSSVHEVIGGPRAPDYRHVKASGHKKRHEKLLFSGAQFQDATRASSQPAAHPEKKGPASVLTIVLDAPKLKQ